MITQDHALITAMITPFTPDNTLNLDEAARIAQHLVATGSDAIVLSGTTGESPTLTHDEELQLYDAVLAAVTCPLIAGTGSNCTQTAINATQAAQRMGVHASLQVVPYYNRPSQAGLYAHFMAIADASEIPLILYTIPSRTGVHLALETILDLATHPQIIGIKDATGTCEDINAIHDAQPDFLIYTGDDALIYPALHAGATGVVSVASHLVGRELRSLIQAYHRQDIPMASQISTRLMPLFKALFMTTNPVPIKAALAKIGFAVGSPRLPLMPLTPDEDRALSTVLAQFGLI